MRVAFEVFQNEQLFFTVMHLAFTQMFHIPEGLKRLVKITSREQITDCSRRLARLTGANQQPTKQGLLDDELTTFQQQLLIAREESTIVYDVRG